MEPTLPFWFKQRQCQVSPVGENTLKVTGPNLAEAYLSVRRSEGGRWLASLRPTPDGAETGITPPELETEASAWDAAFELYRLQFIV